MGKSIDALVMVLLGGVQTLASLVVGAVSFTWLHGTVARTLMGNRYLVLLDEPSEGVAPVNVEGMAQMILELKAAGVSNLLSEPNLHFATWVSGRAYVLEKGQIRHHGTMQELADDDEVRRAYLSM